MDKKSVKKLLIMQSTTESNRQESDEKMKKLIEDLKEIITPTITSMMVLKARVRPTKIYWHVELKVY